jgi:hypothetical protein
MNQTPKETHIMAKHSEHQSRTGKTLLVGHGEHATVVHELGDKPERIVRETISSAKGVRDREV